MPRPGYSTLVPCRREYSMAETIRRVDYFYLTVPSKPGEGVRILNTLKEADINLLAFSDFQAAGEVRLTSYLKTPLRFEK